MKSSRSHSGERAFTLVEIMIVVAIIGVVALLAIPNMLRARQRAQISRVASDFRVASEAVEMYVMLTGSYPADVPRGVIPVGMETDLAKMHWSDKTAIGGNWDWDLGVFSIVAAVSIVDYTIDASQAAELDATIDDGNLASGAFILNGSRLMYIVEE